MNAKAPKRQEKKRQDKNERQTVFLSVFLDFFPWRLGGLAFI
jgi:hypothetical protein